VNDNRPASTCSATSSGRSGSWNQIRPSSSPSIFDCVVVHADHMVAVRGHAGRRDQTDVTDSDDREVHEVSPPGG
jgi:hypothetical protein